jgi:hypothetical protein
MSCDWHRELFSKRRQVSDTHVAIGTRWLQVEVYYDAAAQDGHPTPREQAKKVTLRQLLGRGCPWGR